MRVIFIYLISCCITFQVAAQSIDSLERILARPELSNAERVEQLNLLARELTYVNPIRSIEVSKQALELASRTNNEKGKAYAFRNLAGAYSYYGSFYLTIDNMQKAIDIFERLNDSAGVANCNISLGHTYRRLRNRPNELQYHKAAYDIFLRLGIPERIGVTAHNLGETYLNIGDYDKSFTLTAKAIVINDSLHNLSVLSSCYKVMGNLYLQRKEYEKAEQNFLQVLSISDKLGALSQKQATIEAMIQLAALYDQREQQDKKLQLLNRAAAFVKENKLTDYVEAVYIQLVEEYIKRNNGEKAREIIQVFKSTRDSLTKIQLEDKNRLTLGFIQLFELEKKNNQLAEENRQQELRLKTRNGMMAGVGLFTLILLILLFLLIRNFRKLKKTNQLLVRQDNIITTQNSKLAELNATKDKFFSVVSHDMKAPLNSLWSFANLLEEKMDTLQRDQILMLVRELRQHLESTTKMTDNLMTWAKLQMKEMKTSPANIPVNDIVDDVLNLYQEIAQTKDIKIQQKVPADATVWADKNQITFIIRNLVNNAVKYTSRGGQILITGENGKENKFVIKVADTGNGIQETIITKLFTAEPIHSMRGTAGEQGSGLGLKLCHEFTQLNQGSLLVASKSGQGTVFSLVLPIRAEAPLHFTSK
jgi:signal transduction histidine kinase